MIPLQPENVRILNPEIMYRTGQVLQTYTEKQKKVRTEILFQLCKLKTLTSPSFEFRRLLNRLLLLKHTYIYINGYILKTVIL